MSKPINPDVISVQPQPDFSLLVAFANGEEKRFDVWPYLNYPIYQKLKQGNYVAKAHVEHGTVVWDEQTDLSPDSLYLLGQPA